MTSGHNPVAALMEKPQDASGRHLAVNAPTVEDLLARVSKENEKFEVPLLGAEVASVVRSVWKAKQEGRLFTTARPGVGVLRVEIDLLMKYPDAFTIFVDLKYNWAWKQGEAFNLANAAARRYGMTLQRFRDAWMRLEGLGFIEVVQPGGRGPHDPRQVRLI